MVRVGGGWAALDEFLIKNDPVRGERCGERKGHASRQGLKVGGWVGAVWHPLRPSNLGSLSSQGEDQPEDPRKIPVLDS